MTFEPLPEKPPKKKPAATGKPALRRPRKKSAWEQYRVLILAAAAGLGLLACLAVAAGGLYLNSLNQALPTLAAPPSGSGDVTGTGGSSNNASGQATSASGGNSPANGASADSNQTGTAAPNAAATSGSSAGGPSASAAPGAKPTFTGTPTPLGGALPTFTPYSTETAVPTWTRSPFTLTPTETEQTGAAVTPATPAPTLEATRKVG